MDCGDPIAFGSPQTKQVTLFVVCMYSIHTLVCVYTIIGHNIGPLILFKGAVCNITLPSYLAALHSVTPQQTGSSTASSVVSTEPPLCKQGYNVTIHILWTMSSDRVST